MKVRKQNGEEYEPNSITAFFRSFDRYLKDKGQTRSVIQDKEFKGARRVLEAKRKNLRKQGKGRKQNAAEALTVDEEEKLRSTKQLGDHSPHSLLQTVWYFNTMHFGWRGSDEHRRVCLRDLHLLEDDRGTEYVEFSVERGTKTRTGCEWQPERAFNPRMYSTGTERCPVRHFKKYINLRPENARENGSPFYLAIANAPNENVWYKNQPLGVHSLSKFMKSMAVNAGIHGRKTSHSARKTMITRLVQSNIHPLHVAQLSGHKNLKSLDSYSVASVHQQKNMSRIISGQPTDITNTMRASSSTERTLIPVMNSATCTQGSSVLPGMTISGNVVNLYFNQISSSQTTAQQQASRKRPRSCILSSDEEDN